MKKISSKRKYMQSWSDSVLNSVNDYSQIISIIALVFTLFAASVLYATAKEINRRSLARETESESQLFDAQKETREAKRVANEANARVAQLETKNAPRILSAQQRQIIIDVLTPYAGSLNLEIDGSNIDEESTNFSNAIIEAVKASGITPDITWTGVIFGKGVLPTGIGIDVRDGTPPPMLALACQHAFMQAGINCPAALYPDWPESMADKVIIRVYKKSDSN